MGQGPWLTSDEMRTWRALDRLVNRLPAALEGQLQRDAGLSFMEYHVLAALSDQTSGSIRISRLAELAHCELSRLSHLISRLARRGFVRREPDPEAARFTLAILTPEGRAHLEAAAPPHVAHVRAMIFDALTTDEQHALRDVARTIVARLDEAGA